jgi:hypothetical protein
MRSSSTTFAHIPPVQQQPHVNLTEVELGKLPGDALEAHHQRRRERRPLLPVQPVEGALAQRQTLGLQQPQILQRRGLRVGHDQLPKPLSHRRRDARQAHPQPSCAAPSAASTTSGFWPILCTVRGDTVNCWAICVVGCPAVSNV